MSSFRPFVALALALAGPACNGGGGAGDGGPADATIPPSDGEPTICTEFTEVGAPCPTASPVRCFPECEAGGCSCTQTPSGRVWVCQTDLSCIPDCAPLDDGCAQVPTGDALAGDDGGADAATDAGADAINEGGGDAGNGSD
jgi:hypothetical protein